MRKSKFQVEKDQEGRSSLKIQATLDEHKNGNLQHMHIQKNHTDYAMNAYMNVLISFASTYGSSFHRFAKLNEHFLHSIRTITQGQNDCATNVSNAHKPMHLPIHQSCKVQWLMLS